jgi:hypothetical protein
MDNFLIKLASIIKQPIRSLDAAQRNRGITVDIGDDCGSAVRG